MPESYLRKKQSIELDQLRPKVNSKVMLVLVRATVK
jgi:hypothetical protein